MVDVSKLSDNEIDLIHKYYTSGIESLSDDELNNFQSLRDKLKAESPTASPTASPTSAQSMIPGVAKEFMQGLSGVGSDPAFEKDSPVASSAANFLGRATGILGPVIGGRYLGGRLARSIKPEVNVEQAGRNAALIAGATAPSKTPVYLRQIRSEVAQNAAEEAAKRNNVFASRLEGGSRFAGGVAGGAAGGGFNAYLHNEDPESGAMYGGLLGTAPVAKPLLSNKFVTWPLATGLAIGANEVHRSGGPDWLAQILKDASLGKILSMTEGKRK